MKNLNKIDNELSESGFDAFKIFLTQIIEPLGFGGVHNICIDRGAKEYHGLIFEYHHKKYMFRQAKITPTKVGQFVTLWKRETPTSDIAPFSVNDGIDGVIIANFDGNRKGYFIFDQAQLGERGIFTKNEVEGKRAIRVYAPWVKTVAKQAVQTQKWQILNFVELGQNDMMLQKAQALLT